MTKMCEGHKQALIEAIDKFNEALKAENLKAMNEAESAAKEAESEFAKQAQLDLFSSHKNDDDPVVGVLKEGFYGTVRHSPVRESGVLLGWELVDGEKQVDMKAMSVYFQKSRIWQIRVERLTEILVEWSSKEVEKSTAGIKDTFKMSKNAKEIDVGPNPTSNTSMLKFLQSVVDEIVFKDDGSGKNEIRVNNRDLKFLQHCFDSEGSGHNDLKTMKPNAVARVVGKILYRVLNGFAYDVKFKTVPKDDDLEAQRKANRKAKEAKAAESAKTDEPIVVEREGEAA